MIKNVNSWQLIDDNLFSQIRDSLESHGWLLSRQKLRTPPFEGVEHHYLAPIKNVCVETLYHATREVNVQVILRGGLARARERTAILTASTTWKSMDRQFWGLQAMGRTVDTEPHTGGRNCSRETIDSMNPNWRILQVDLVD